MNNKYSLYTGNNSYDNEFLQSCGIIQIFIHKNYSKNDDCFFTLELYVLYVMLKGSMKYLGQHSY